ncbi:glycosyl hydrolase family 18 protein [Butyrivibrio sp. INlla16]|uniref:glycosyl hydrolase family 18 protein n=1 Tax=Butyrivibrio sp. INlla16 TaxID=1520807 RepID=UPI0008883236|nr:glycosyl hydrolase family 18 protein [Butyrivibrio sp. INlla16]SDB36232.1 Spore germination protein YaaH [Butyrivibrio sp. INlla16]
MKKKIKPVIFIIALIILFGLIYAGQLAFERFSYTKERVDLNEYYGLTDPTQAVLILNDKLMEEKAGYYNDRYYLDYELVQTDISNRFYYGADDGLLIYTGPNAIYTATVGESIITSSAGDSEDLGFPASLLEGDKLYVSVDYLKKFASMKYESFADEGPARIRIYTSDAGESQNGTLKKDIAIRKLGGRKSEVVTEAPAGTVTVIEEMEEWSRVISSNGHIGYVENKHIKDVAPVVVSVDDGEGKVALGEYTSMSLGSKVNMGFHPIGGIQGNETVSGILAQAKSLNVISPTWFSLDGNEGNISSYATHDYITAAHAAGVQVWAAVDNFNNPNGCDTEAVVSHAASRANLIANLMAQQAEFGFDGINVDFELIDESYSRSYLEFLRELSVACRQNQIVLSADDYVPMDFNDHYDLTEQGIVCDYVIIMGYDEHYSGSSEAGSVASIGYVQSGIQKALEQVPAEKLVNSVPFYTRLWTTSGGELSSKAFHMDGVANVISEKGIELKWDENTCQYYGEATAENGDFYQIWNEDARSLEAKLNVMQSAGIAGVAEWALGFETADVWDVIAEYMAK